MKKKTVRWAILWMAASSVALAQPGPQGPPPQQPGQPRMQPGPTPQPDRRQGQPGMFPGTPPGKWWHNPEMVQRLNLTSDQQKKMDDVFQASRLRLIDLTAALQKEEAMLDPLINAEQLDDAKVLPQLDKVAQARAELEKANARLLVGIRHVLTADQWRRVSMPQPHPQPGPAGPRPMEE